MIRLRPIAGVDFLGKLSDIADPPFCFSCKTRRGSCKCKEGPLSKQEWLKALRLSLLPREPLLKLNQR